MAWAEEAGNEYVVTFYLAAENDGGWNSKQLKDIESLKQWGDVTDIPSGFIVELTGLPYDRLVVHLVPNCGDDMARIKPTMRMGLEAHNPDMVFGTWFNSYQAVQELAAEYPNVIFSHCSSYPLLKSADFDNVATYFEMHCVSDKIVGAVAKAAGYKNAGFVGTHHSLPEPLRALNAFALGFEGPVTAVWTDEWLDIPAERMAADTLIAMEEFDVIRQLPDTPTVSIAACENGITALGYGLSTLSVAPCTLISNEWGWAKYYQATVLAGINGTWVPHDWFEPDSALVWHPEASDELKAVAAAMDPADTWAGPISGHGWDMDGNEYKVYVPKGKTLTKMDILTMYWLVYNVQTGKRPQTPKEYMPTRFIVD